jgi:diacylglycerol kinase (ATP)
MTSALVIGRRRRGRPIARSVRETEALLTAAGWSVERSVVKRKKDLRKRVAAAVDASMDVVVAVGGDGAVLQAVQRLAGTSLALGIVPMGTGNLLATNLDIPRALPDAVNVLITGGRRQIDVGRVSMGSKDRRFSVACGIGFDAKVMDATPMRDKRRWGKLAYALHAVRESRSLRDVEHRIVLDGKQTTTDAAQILIANFGRTGLRLEPRLPIEPDDGQLDVIALRAPGRSTGLLAVWEALRQRRTGRSESGRVLRARARTIEIATKTKRLVEIDGSVVGKTPISVSVEPRALTVITPAAAADASSAAPRLPNGSREPNESGEATASGEPPSG